MFSWHVSKCLLEFKLLFLKSDACVQALKEMLCVRHKMNQHMFFFSNSKALRELLFPLNNGILNTNSSRFS